MSAPEVSLDAITLLREVLQPGLWPVEDTGSSVPRLRRMHRATISPRRMSRWQAALAEIEAREAAR